MILKNGRVPKSKVVTVSEWTFSRQKILDDVSSFFGTSAMAVRSSAISEDTIYASNAGAYLSVLNVSSADLEISIDKVLHSYAFYSLKNEVLIQEMLQNVIRSGVAFSHDPNTCSPYRVINWSESEDTTAVTGGLHPDRIWHQTPNYPGEKPHGLNPIIDLITELSELYQQNPLDLEFAVTKEANEEVVWLLQVRPLILSKSPETQEQQRERIETISSRITEALKPHPFLVGKTTAFGIMPDWNPAEILGVKPKPLALSLYRELITDSIWAYQRDNYGYRNLRSFPLMSHFFGLPYIDVRVSFNSFVPADLSDCLAGKLVDHYLDQLISTPTLHDKVEFEIVYSCYTLDLPVQLQKLRKYSFNNEECEEIEISLRKLTNSIVNPVNGLYKIDEKKLLILQDRRNLLADADLDSLGRIYWLIEDTKRYGTLPFAGLARAGFIAIQMLKSLVSTGIITEDDYHNFLNGVPTVSRGLVSDRKSMSNDDFFKKYGHLRPGTYDIMSSRYDEKPELYFNDFINFTEDKSDKFTLSNRKLMEISRVLQKNNLNVDVDELLQFVRDGIQLREYSKFEFTKNISNVLLEISRFAREYGLSDDDVSYSKISDFKEMHLTTFSNSEFLQKSIAEGRELYEQTARTLLPPLITSPMDISGFEWPTTTPNFITNRQVTARVADTLDIDNLTDAIVCIPNADPGFDWIFSHRIAGLITAWGGANSHMAIRAHELGLPSVIGAGELLYRKWSRSRMLFVDCANKIVEVIP